MSNIDVETKHGTVGPGDVWVVRKKDGTKATLYFGNPRGDFFVVSELLPSLNLEYAFSREEFEACPEAKRLKTTLRYEFADLIKGFRTRRTIETLEREHNNF